MAIDIMLGILAIVFFITAIYESDVLSFFLFVFIGFIVAARIDNYIADSYKENYKEIIVNESAQECLCQCHEKTSIAGGDAHGNR